MEAIAGMKELNQKLSHIDRSLERIAKTLEQTEKILNRMAPQLLTPATQQNTLTPEEFESLDYMDELEDEY